MKTKEPILFQPCGCPGCTVMIPLDRWLCPYHWKRVPRSVQRRLFVAFRRWQLGEGLEELKAIECLALAEIQAFNARAGTAAVGKGGGK